MREFMGTRREILQEQAKAAFGRRGLIVADVIMRRIEASPRPEECAAAIVHDLLSGKQFAGERLAPKREALAPLAMAVEDYGLSVWALSNMKLAS